MLEILRPGDWVILAKFKPLGWDVNMNQFRVEAIDSDGFVYVSNSKIPYMRNMFEKIDIKPCDILVPCIDAIPEGCYKAVRVNNLGHVWVEQIDEGSIPGILGPFMFSSFKVI